VSVTVAILRSFVSSQKSLSKLFDRLLPAKFTLDGNRDFADSFVPRYIRDDATVYCIGGGKSPLIGIDEKRRKNLTLIGLDVDAEELRLAPEGSYDETICADISDYQGHQDADIVICRAVLEHVADVESAFRSIHGILKPGGVALVFTPSGNALYARLNRVLPEKTKKALLFGVSPETQKKQGFRAYYDKCTPRDFRKLANLNGLIIEKQRFYFISSYFSCFFPAYLLWRCWGLLGCLMVRHQAAETFSMALRKPE
jgi:SAM-dependent methyltransferase